MKEHAPIVSDIFHGHGFNTTIIGSTVFIHLTNVQVYKSQVMAIIDEEELPIDDSRLIENRYKEVEIRLGE